MRPENQKMKEYLALNGIDCTPKYLFDGSLKKTWRLYNPKIKWWDNTVLQNKLKELGFKDYNGHEITNTGNGGAFSVFLRAPLEMMQQIFNTETNLVPANKATADVKRDAKEQSNIIIPQQLTTRSQRRQIRLDKVCRIYGKKIRSGANIPKYL